MNFGEKIKRIRMFRGFTQKELGIQLGYGESSADVRIAQYESGARKPKKDTLCTLTDILGVSTDNLLFRNTEVELLQLLSWLEEERPEAFHFSSFGEKENAGKQIDSVGIYFNDESVNEYLMGWMEQKQKLQKQKITPEEYKEWKWNELTKGVQRNRIENN